MRQYPQKVRGEQRQCYAACEKPISSVIETMDTESNQFQVNNANHIALNHSERQPLRCANCDIEILWPPIVVEGKTYCCVGCAAGGPCSCDYSQYRSVNISGVIHYLGRD